MSPHTLDVVQYMQLGYHKTYDYPPAASYDDEPDVRAIDNLHKLQANRPLKPPGVSIELEENS